jgi:enoyl-CoA hydratase/carnithine racemase
MNNKAQPIQLSITDTVATITLNNPKRHNALERNDLHAFLNALKQVAAQPTLRALVITGAGEKTFCAGVSLQQMNSGDLSTDTFEELTNRLDAFPLPTLCALNGSAYGGGAEIALACDFRIGVYGTRMFVPVARFGLCYPLSGVQRYVAKLGVGPTKRLLMANETWPAEEMYRLGFLD